MSRRWAHVTVAQQVRVGDGQVARLRPLLKEVGARRLLLLGSSRALDGELGKRLVDGLGRTIGVSTYVVGSDGVTTTAVQAATRLALGEQVDTVVSFGGSSVIDLGKAVTFFVEQQAGTPGDSFLDHPKLSHVAIPTTFCGAAGSAHFSMIDPLARRAQVAASPTLAPRWIVWDPAVLETLPADRVAATGLAALTHALEVAVAPSRSPESEAVALAAFGRVYGSLPAAAEGDAEALASLQEGAALAARAWMHAAPGLAHGLAQIIAARASVAYADALACVTPIVLRFNAEVVGAQLEQVGRQVMTEDLPGAVASLASELGISGGLSGLGVTEDDADAAARTSQSNPFAKANPRPASEVEVRGLLDAAWS